MDNSQYINENFKIIKLISTGSFGTVYKAKNKNQKDKIAIKVIQF